MKVHFKCALIFCRHSNGSNKASNKYLDYLRLKILKPVIREIIILSITGLGIFKLSFYKQMVFTMVQP